jgi:hydroxyacylglutathione hydrolase
MMTESFLTRRYSTHEQLCLPARHCGSEVIVHIIRDILAQSYLLQTPQGLYLVDTGLPGNASRILSIMQTIGRDDLQCIFITHAHFDHYGSAQALRQQTQAPLIIHEQDAGFMQRGETPVKQARGIGRLGKICLPLVEQLWSPPKIQADILVSDGFEMITFGLDATVIHTPGHTPGSCCLLLAGAYLFAGDLMTTRIQRLYADNWQELQTSYNRVMALRPRIIFSGHGRKLTFKKKN